MDSHPLDLAFRPPKGRKRSRRAVAIFLVVLAFVGSAVFYLATSGTVGSSFSAAPGTVDGEVANVIPMSATVSRSVGAAQLQSGITIARVLVAKDFTNHNKVSIAWLNPQDATRVLNNPNAQIAMGIYRPVHTGSCTGSDPNTAVSVDDNTLSGNSTSAADFCAYLDTGATSSPPFDQGQLLLSRTMLTGYLRPSVDGSTGAACGSGTTAWCQPSAMSTNGALAGDETLQRAFYVIASILTPGGNPQGNVSQLNTLSFNVIVKRTGNPSL